MNKQAISAKLQDKIVEYIQKYLLEQGFEIPSHKNFDKNVENYLTFKNKTFFVDKKWKVVLNPELKYATELQKGLDLLQEHLENGIDIQRHLSKNFVKEYNDMLVNDWGIHHFHLGKMVENDGFIKRTKDLAFIKFHNDKAYIIAIQPHGDWANKEFIETVDKYWSETIEHSLCKDVSSLSFNPTNKQQEDFRKLGVNSAIQLKNGKVYMPFIGYNLSGSGMYVSFSFTKIYRCIDEVATYLENKDIKNLDEFNFFGFILSEKAFGTMISEIVWSITTDNKKLLPIIFRLQTIPSIFPFFTPLTITGKNEK